MSVSRSLSVVGLAAAALALAACGSSGDTTAPAAAPASAPASASVSAAAPAAGSTVALATTSLGPTVVDAQGRTLYMFTKDTAGTAASACSDTCATAWPAYTVDGAVSSSGVSGALATIATADGGKQVTLNGWPLYHFAKDAKAGDVHGQDVNSVWFVLDASGQPVKAAATTSAPAAAADTTGGGSGY